MEDKEYRERIEKAHDLYRKYLPVKCPHLGNELIVFNRHGFNHIERRGKKLRLRKEVIKRLGLLPLTTEIISSLKSVCDFRTEKIKGDVVKYWGLTYEDRFRVVIRQINSGQKHFFSIMPRLDNHK